MIPIAVFAFNRPKSLKRLLESLTVCSGFHKKRLRIFVGGPRDGGDQASVNETCHVALNFVLDASQVVIRRANFGLEKSIERGLDEVFGSFESVIVLEDDLELHHQFLEFMDACLQKYAASYSFVQVSGSSYQVDSRKQSIGVVALPSVSSWGWGTWKDKWKHYRQEISSPRDMDLTVVDRKKFNFYVSYDYLNLANRVLSGKLKSWAIKLHY